MRYMRYKRRRPLSSGHHCLMEGKEAARELEEEELEGEEGAKVVAVWRRFQQRQRASGERSRRYMWLQYRRECWRRERRQPEFWERGQRARGARSTPRMFMSSSVRSVLRCAREGGEDGKGGEGGEDVVI